MFPASGRASEVDHPTGGHRPYRRAWYRVETIRGTSDASNVGRWPASIQNARQRRSFGCRSVPAHRGAKDGLEKVDASRSLPRLTPATVPGAGPRPLDVNSSVGGGAPAASAGTAVGRDESDCVGGAPGPVTAPSLLGAQVPAPRIIVVVGDLVRPSGVW